MEESSSRLAPSDSKRRSDAGARHAQPESKLQVACVAWADTQDLLVDGSPGGEAYRKGARPGSLSPATVGCQPAAAGRLFASGLAPLCGVLHPQVDFPGDDAATRGGGID